MFTYILESTAERRTRRDNDIKTLFQRLTIRENMSFMEAYEAVGYVFYLSADHVQKSYPRIDEAARARQKIWNRIGKRDRE